MNCADNGKVQTKAQTQGDKRKAKMLKTLKKLGLREVKKTSHYFKQFSFLAFFGYGCFLLVGTVTVTLEVEQVQIKAQISGMVCGMLRKAASFSPLST